MTKSEKLKNLFEKSHSPAIEHPITNGVAKPSNETDVDGISIESKEAPPKNIGIAEEGYGSSNTMHIQAKKKSHKKKPSASYVKILNECISVANDRQKTYGSPLKNFQDTSDLCKTMFGIEISPTSIIRILIAMKHARQKHLPKHDNLIDIANYTVMLADLTKDQTEANK